MTETTDRFNLISKAAKSFNGIEDADITKLIGRIIKKDNKQLFNNDKNYIKDFLIDVNLLFNDGVINTIDSTIDDLIDDNEDDEYISNMQCKEDDVEDNRIYSRYDVIEYLDDTLNCLTYNDIIDFIEL